MLDYVRRARRFLPIFSGKVRRISEPPTRALTTTIQLNRFYGAHLHSIMRAEINCRIEVDEIKWAEFDVLPPLFNLFLIDRLHAMLRRFEMVRVPQDTTR